MGTPQLRLLMSQACSVPCGLVESECMLQFKKLEELETTPANNIVDVIGIVEHVEAWATITRRDGTETQKRSITIKDKSNRSIEVRAHVRTTFPGTSPASPPEIPRATLR